MQFSTPKYLIILAGPTAVGKTSLSVQLARELGTEIISADSRQIFRELNIGTAKPDAVELAAVPHHFINSHTISESYSAGDFERDVLRLLEKLFLKYDYVVLTGGSGFYIKAVSEGLDDLPSPLPRLRQQLTGRLHHEGLSVLQNEISQFDPVFAASTEFLNAQRVIRALEVYHTTGMPISSFQRQKQSARPFHQIQIALDRDRAELYRRIDDRMDTMLKAGLVQEARDLISFRSHHALQTVGYKEVYGYLDGEYDEAEMEKLLKQNSRRYAKRQLTWFRHQGNFHWFHADNLDGVLRYIQDEINSHKKK
ncbi:tRNA (adenosine(37)-N6)-dimethylallyltransferase MiaA [Dyadobacter sandarakinus]|uniref:tRNA dimethylallyltransferase n=1 Tax=Dyadobacter sandarakinus TaxID=2747268 RepID=A0ABX7IET5_9BACT|nr:tRNA (adenosine(37)-N6)-dimethylallyltransferase MiaA [Dyadobacter sandarakinus]QRR03603.1 tRNA (adenosine(37)-N6)-dimethylallyltransferase MiaA [Dyadobacter sandarakinus]